MRKTIGLVSGVLVVTVVAVIAAFYLSLVPRSWSEDTPPIRRIHFTLIDHHGNTVSETDFPGKYLLVYFGYTYCPDVCPTSLQMIGDALERLGPRREEVGALFVTVDPDRDTAPVLADYVSAFNPRITGLTGSKSQIKNAAAQFGVFFEKRGKGDSYGMDHSSLIYLVSPDDRLVATLRHGATVEDLTRLLRERLPD